MSADCTRCSNDCPWGETLCPRCRDYEILHLLERIAVAVAGVPGGRTGVWLRCANCERATTTGLCGCENAQPQPIGAFIWPIRPLDEEALEQHR